MPRIFDDHEFAQLSWDARQLVGQALDYEQALVSVVAAMDDRSISQSPAVVDLLPRVRQLCVAAREHRELMEAFTARLTGEPIKARTGQHAGVKILVVDDADDTRDV